jgi:hypothetical protein
MDEETKVISSPTPQVGLRHVTPGSHPQGRPQSGSCPDKEQVLPGIKLTIELHRSYQGPGACCAGQMKGLTGT